MKNNVLKALGAAILIALSGCATKPQGPIGMMQGALGESSGRVGVALAKLPQPDTNFPGAACLLCLATASAANRTLTSHAATLPVDDLAAVKADLVERLKKKGVNVVPLPVDVDMKELPDWGGKGENIARKDFSEFARKHQVAKLLVVEIGFLGFERQYSSYIPTSDPKATLRGAAYLVNLRTNTYEWYLPVTETASTDRNWDEPPKFPGLSNAYFQTVERAKDQILGALPK